MYIEKYNKAIKSPNTTFICLVELLDNSETQGLSVMFDLYESSGNIKVSFQNGTRRTIKIVLDNSDNKYDVDINKIWLYQKFRVFTGIRFYNSDGQIEEMLFPQGVYYINNPESVYSPDFKTITFEGVDKWARLDGSLGGTLEATYAFPKTYTDKNGVKHQQEYNMFDVIRNLLKTPIRTDIRNIAFMPSIDYSDNINNQINKFLDDNGFDIYAIKYKEAVTDNATGRKFYCNNYPMQTENVRIAPIWQEFVTDDKLIIDNIDPLLHHWFLTDDKLGYARVLMPYSITKKMGSTIADILLEINTILGGNMYYDRTGRLVVEPTQDQINDDEKEVVWRFVEGDGILADIQLRYDFENVYNQVVVQSSIIDSGVYTVWVQDENPISPVNIHRIGTKTIVYDNVGTYDYRLFMELLDVNEETAMNYVKENLREYAQWLLKQHTALHHTVTIKCLPLHHLDVNQVVSITLKDGKTNKYLITDLDIPLNPTDTMSITAVSINPVR